MTRTRVSDQHYKERVCGQCAFRYQPAQVIRLLRWFFNQDWNWVDRQACPSMSCRGGR